MPHDGHGLAHDATPRADLGRGSGVDKLLFLDAFSGISGDMLLGALVDLGVPPEIVSDAVETLGVEGWTLRWERLFRSGIAATHLVVDVADGQPQRSWGTIRSLIEGADLTDGARAIVLSAFGKLARAEAEVHGVPPEDVHFHEVGAVDSIVDMVGAAAALDHLGARVVASPIPLGRAMITAQHGPLPVPVPATVSCLSGVPTYDGQAEAELVTPTGACLVATVAREFMRWPDMRPERVGWGAGSRTLPDRPNLLRLVLGEPTGPRAISTSADSPLVVLEANIDDMSGELAANTVDAALLAGALDAWTVPIQMKKGRPAIMICALSRRQSADAIARVMLSESTTLGVRVRPSDRIERPRRVVKVQTPYGEIDVKLASGDGLPPNIAPEYEACRTAAAAHGVPLKEVYAAALAAARAAV